jgi:hypothetical protein
MIYIKLLTKEECKLVKELREAKELFKTDNNCCSQPFNKIKKSLYEIQKTCNNFKLEDWDGN